MHQHYIFAWFQTIFVVVTGLITYKLLTFQRPDNTTFLVTLLKACMYLYAQDQNDIPSVDSNVEKAAVVLSVIMKQHGHPVPTDGESKLWDKTVPLPPKQDIRLLPMGESNSLQLARRERQKSPSTFHSKLCSGYEIYAQLLHFILSSFASIALPLHGKPHISVKI